MQPQFKLSAPTDPIFFNFSEKNIIIAYFYNG